MGGSMFQPTDATYYGIAIAVLLTFFILGKAGIAGIRSFVIKLTEFCTILILVGAAVAGTVFGYKFASGLAVINHAPIDNVSAYGMIGAAAGAFVFFAAASIPLSIIFLLSEIADNSHRTAQTIIGLNVRDAISDAVGGSKSTPPPSTPNPT